MKLKTVLAMIHVLYIEYTLSFISLLSCNYLLLYSDLAQHYLSKSNITAIRRVRKTDNNRIARACGGTIVNRTDELREEDVGTGCGLFEVRKIGDEYFTYLIECKNPQACTVVLRGASKDILNEVIIIIIIIIIREELMFTMFVTHCGSEFFGCW